MHCIFELHPHSAEGLQAQVSHGLEKRTELLSRKQYASLWKVTDRLNSRQTGTNEAGRKHKVLPIFNLVLGSFLLLTAILARAQGQAMSGTVIFVALLAVGTGILRLRSGSMERSSKKRFDQAAEMLLDRLSKVEAGQVKVIFDPEGMEMQEGEHTEHFAYDMFECILEEEDLFLVTFDGRVLVLPKADLAEGSSDDLRKIFLQAQDTILHNLAE